MKIQRYSSSRDFMVIPPGMTVTANGQAPALEAAHSGPDKLLYFGCRQARRITLTGPGVAHFGHPVYDGTPGMEQGHDYFVACLSRGSHTAPALWAVALADGWSESDWAAALTETGTGL